MATEADVKAGIDRALDILFSELADIVELSETWEDEPDHSRYSEMLTWNADMSRLRLDLDPAYRSDRMTRQQMARYGELLRQLKDILPIIDKLGFSPPPISLDSAA